MSQTRYDVAIVGAGFSGPILAAKIVEKGANPKNGERLKVALIDGHPNVPGVGAIFDEPLGDGPLGSVGDER